MTITYTHEDDGDIVTVIAIHPSEGEIGFLRFFEPDPYGRVVDEIGVHLAHRRKGIATAMWRYAEINGFRPSHSPWRTDDGDAWAESTGERMPDRIV